MHYVQISGSKTRYGVGKVVCVGRNYADHARELNNPVPAEPLWFIKPGSAVVSMQKQLIIPSDRGECHHEVEVAVLIGKTCTAINERDARDAIAGIGLGLDLTLRDIQASLKQKGHPWEIAKAFDGSCALSNFSPADEFPDLQAIEFALDINGKRRQTGSTQMQLFPVAKLVAVASQNFTLEPGDVVLTGTPAGVGVLNTGDLLHCELNGKCIAELVVVAR
ncbi:MAG: fumarylacetoacetate hydrolase family protein [Fibrobacterota bacterium]